MEGIQKGLKSKIANLSDQNYETSLKYFRFWSEIGHTHFQLSADVIFDTIHGYRVSSLVSHGTAIYPKTGLILRFIDDIESDPTFVPHCAGFRGRFCVKILQSFFDNDMDGVYPSRMYASVPETYYADVNYVAHCANLGYIEENTIRNHLLQSLLSHDKMHEHQVSALAILFKLAGATFGAYADPAVIDRCFGVFDSQLYSGWGRGLVRASAFSLYKRSGG